MSLDWRHVLFEVLNFLVLVALLRRFIFTPVRAAVLARKEEEARRAGELDAREVATTRLQAELSGRLAGLEAEAADARRAAQAAAAAEAERVVAAARGEREALLARAREEAAAAGDDALRRLRDEVAAVAIDAAGRVVAGLGQPALVDSFARLGAERLQAAGLPPDTSVHVAASPGADLEQVRRVLAEVLGDRPFVLCHDAGLRTGVRLVAGDLDVEASAGASLAGWLAASATEPRADRA